MPILRFEEVPDFDQLDDLRSARECYQIWHKGEKIGFLWRLFEVWYADKAPSLRPLAQGPLPAEVAGALVQRTD